jgi:hypothetical protein
MPVITSKAPPWQPNRSDFIVLWHGCTNDNRQSIEQGIALGHCAPDTDFGRGFYTTTLDFQARQWAWIRFFKWQRANPNRKNNWPVVLRFRVRRYTPPTATPRTHERGLDSLLS